MRYMGLREVKDAGFDILEIIDDGMGGSGTIVYKSNWSGWYTKPNGKWAYRSADVQVGSAYRSTHGTRTYSIDPDNDPKVRSIIKKFQREG